MWWPQVVQAGVRYAALVLPQSAIAQLSLNAMRATAPTQSQPSPLETRNFSVLSEAEKWLRSLS